VPHRTIADVVGVRRPWHVKATYYRIIITLTVVMMTTIMTI